MYAHVGGTQPLELLDDGAGLGGAASPDPGGRAAPVPPAQPVVGVLGTGIPVGPNPVGVTGGLFCV